MVSKKTLIYGGGGAIGATLGSILSMIFNPFLAWFVGGASMGFVMGYADSERGTRGVMSRLLLVLAPGAAAAIVAYFIYKLWP